MLQPGRVLCSTALVACLAAAPAAAFGPDVTASNPAFRFVVFHDTHLTLNDLSGSRAHLRAAIDELNAYASEFDFVLVAGDMADGASLTRINIELDAAREELDRLMVPYYTTIGNSDVAPSGDTTAYRSQFGEPTYAFEHKGVEIMSLNTVSTQSMARISTGAISLFESLLEEVDSTKPVIVFSHHPLGPLAPLGPDNRQAFYTVIDQHNLIAAFSGQYRALFEEERNGAWYFSSRALGLNVANHDGSGEKGYSLVTVWPDFAVSAEFFALGQPPRFTPAPPRLTRLAPRFALAGRPVSFQVSALRGSSTDKYAASNLPSGASFSPTTRMFAWTPGTHQAGLQPNIEFSLSNDAGADRATASIRVLNAACVHDDFAPPREVWSAYGGTWTVQNGLMLQTSSTGGSYFNLAPAVLQDFYLEADVRLVAGQGYAGLAFRYVDPRNNYYLWDDGNVMAVRRRVNGVASQISASVPAPNLGRWRHVRVEAVGKNIRVYHEGELLIDVQDGTFTSGRIGVLCSQAAAEFDNVVAVGCPDLPNRAPVLQRTSNMTAYKGIPLQTQLRAEDPDVDPLAFSGLHLPSRARLTPGGTFRWTPTDADVGKVYRPLFSVSDGELLDNQQVVINVIDPAQACIWMDFATVPFGPVLLESADLPPPDAPILPDTTTWVQRSGHLIGKSPDTVQNFLVPDLLDDYTAEARLRVDGPEYGNLIFRVVDSNRFYYLYTDNVKRTVEIRRRYHNDFKILAEGATVFGDIEGVWHHYQVQVAGDTIRVWVDGDRRYEIRDPEAQGGYLSGGVGFRVKQSTLTVDYLSIRDCSQRSAASPEATPEPSSPAQVTDLIAFPNPFNPMTTVRFQMSRAGLASVFVADVAGRRVRSLVDGNLEPGPQHVVWDGRDARGQAVPSGVYYLRIHTPTQRISHNLVLVK